MKPLITAALIAGVITFFVPGGEPWMSTEAGLAAMGRIISPNWLIDILAQLVLSFVYGAIIASAIYSLPTAGGIVLGTFLGLPIYFANCSASRQMNCMPASRI